MHFTAQEIATLLGGKVEGNPAHVVSGIAKIEDANQQSLSFLANPSYERYAHYADAGILLLNQNFKIVNPKVAAIIRVADPYAAFTRLLEVYQEMKQSTFDKKGIQLPSHVGKDTNYGADFFLGAFAYVGDGVTIGKDVKIYPGAYIGDGVTIADNTIIYPNVVIYEGCKIGANTIIHSGVVIGSDGFGFAPAPDGSYKKIPQTGIVEVGNYVEIGANTVIDRATIGATIIHNGVKLDNLIHLAHNVEVGENTVMAAQVGVSGSTRIGKQVMIGGQAGIVGHIKIADGVKINAQAGVSKAIQEPNKALTGSPAMDFREHYKGLAYLKRIPELLQRIEELEKQLKS